MGRLEAIEGDTAKYVAIQSVSGSERELAGTVFNDLRAIGHNKVEMIDGNNVALLIPGVNRNRLLILNSHLDTIPFKGKKRDLYKLRKVDDWLVGAGAGDNKVGIAMEMDIARKYKPGASLPPCDIMLTFSELEEVGGFGSLKVAAWLEDQHSARYDEVGGIILEPTYNEKGEFFGIGHRGATPVTVTATGPTGHAGKDYGYDLPALTRVARFMGDLPRLQVEWQKKYAHDLLDLPTANPTILRAGGNMTNQVPATAEGVFDLRTTPAMNTAWPIIKTKLEDKYGVTLKEAWPPNHGLCDPDSLIYQVINDRWSDELGAFPYGCDMNAFAEHSTPTVIYGPGYLPDIHTTGDRVSRTAIVEAGRNIDYIIREYPIFKRQSGSSVAPISVQ
jgi:acetylornithine deacetylase/succinyl-diaminopimelate desuccinylase-like protein